MATRIVLTRGARYQYKGFLYEHGVPAEVAEDTASYLVETGFFEAAPIPPESDERRPKVTTVEPASEVVPQPTPKPGLSIRKREPEVKV